MAESEYAIGLRQRALVHERARHAAQEARLRPFREQKAAALARDGAAVKEYEVRRYAAQVQAARAPASPPPDPEALTPRAIFTNDLEERRALLEQAMAARRRND